MTPRAWLIWTPGIQVGDYYALLHSNTEAVVVLALEKNFFLLRELTSEEIHN